MSYADAFALLVSSELRTYLSSKIAVFWTFLVPIAMFVVLSHLVGSRRIPDYDFYLATGLVVVSILTAALMGLSVPLVAMRENRLLGIYQAMPMPRLLFMSAFVFARVLIVIVFSAIFLLFIDFVFSVRFDFRPAHLAAGLGILMLGALSFVSIGLVIASRATNVATANVMANAVYMPMAFLGNLFISTSALPRPLRSVLSLLPVNSLGDGLRSALRSNELLAAPLFGDLAVLTAWSVACLLIARTIFIWQPSGR